MKMVNNIGFLERSAKALKDDERQRIYNYLNQLSPEQVDWIQDIGKQFHQSSAVNGTWFWRTVPIMAEHLPKREFEIWLVEGTGTCRASWECSLAFLKASPEIVKSVTPDIFLNWIQIGRVLTRFSNHDALWFFKSSEKILSELNQYNQQLLTEWVLKMIEHSWQAAASCLKVWTEIVRFTEEQNLKNLLEKGYKLCIDVPDDAQSYFLALPEFLKRFGNDHMDKWVDGAYILGKDRRGTVSAYFNSTPGLALKVLAEEFDVKVTQWVNRGHRLASMDGGVAGEFFSTTPKLLKGFDWTDLEKWVLLIERINEKFSAQGALAFTRSTVELMHQLDIKEIELWVDFGLKTIIDKNRFVYFTLKSQESRDAISRFRTGLHLESVKKILLIYYEGLTGKTMTLRNATDLPGKIHDNNRLFGTLDTRRFYLPDVIKLYEDNQENLRLYRAMMMHLAAHREFGTLELAIEDIKELAVNRLLGLIFEYMEDNRVDYLATRKYPGLNNDFDILIQSDLNESDKTAKNHPVLYFLKYFLWPDVCCSGEPIPNEIKACFQQFWANVVKDSSSAQDTLNAARKIVKIMRGEGGVSHRSLEVKNLIYRGKIKYDLLHTAMTVDEERNQDSVVCKQPANGKKKSENINLNGTDLQAGNCKFNPHSEFYIWLRKQLHKFMDDEENPYRMTAYYDEWDRTLNDYKKDWCKVREIVLKPSTGKFVNLTIEEHYGMINTLKRYFGMLRPDRFRRFSRQDDGEEIDADAIIEAMVDLRAGISHDDGFYIRRDKRERDVAVGFLLDLSYSTEEKIGETGKTLLDVEKQSVIVMAEALEVLGDKYAIYGFNSDGRDKINFYVVKDFEDVYTTEIKQRFGGFQSYGMTRLGAAIRHAIFKLEQVQAAIKILILLSDGRPFDFDYNSGLTKDYEPMYPETDTRMALREAKMRGINPFCITVDRNGQEYMDFTFGNVSYIIIDDVNALPTKLTETYKNLTT